MAAGSWTLFYHVPELALEGTVDFDAADRFRVVLVSSSYTPSQAHTAWSDISANELSTANGYTANGVGMTQTVTRSSGTTTFDMDDPTWTASGGPITARYAVLMHDANGDGTIASTDVPIAYLLLDTTPADYTVTDGNTFTININASGVFTAA